jgi:hypothetical protein
LPGAFTTQSIVGWAFTMLIVFLALPDTDPNAFAAVDDQQCRSYGLAFALGTMPSVGNGLPANIEGQTSPLL